MNYPKYIEAEHRYSIKDYCNHPHTGRIFSESGRQLFRRIFQRSSKRSRSKFFSLRSNQFMTDQPSCVGEYACYRAVVRQNFRLPPIAGFDKGHENFPWRHGRIPVSLDGKRVRLYCYETERAAGWEYCFVS